MATVRTIALGNQQFFDNDGNPLSGGTVESFIAGTSTNYPLYDYSGTVELDNPLTLDSSGRAEFRFDVSTDYKLILRDSNGVEVWTERSIQTGGEGITQDVADARYLKLDCSNDPLTSDLEIANEAQAQTKLTLTNSLNSFDIIQYNSGIVDLGSQITINGTSVDITGELSENGVRLVNYNRAINNGTGILGGGDLSTDRTLSVDTSVIATIAYVDSQTGNSTLDDVTTNGNTTANSISIGGLTASSGDFSGNVELDGILDTKRPAIEQVRVGYTRSQANTLGIYDNTTQKGGLQNRTADTAGATIPLRVFSNAGFDLLLDPGGKTVNDGDLSVSGNCTLGSLSTDTHNVNGSLAFELSASSYGFIEANNSLGLLIASSGGQDIRFSSASGDVDFGGNAVVNTGSLSTNGAINCPNLSTTAGGVGTERLYWDSGASVVKWG